MRDTRNRWLAAFPALLLLSVPPCEAGKHESIERIRQASGTNAPVVEGADGWLFATAELRHLTAGEFWGDRAASVSRASKPEWADPQVAIEDFMKRLAARGIELLLVPVPPKALIYSDKITGTSLAALPTPHGRFYDRLRDRGVEVLDVTSDFLSERSRSGGQQLYCRTDSHFSPEGGRLIAGRIAARIRESAWFSWNGKAAVETAADLLTLTGDLGRLLKPDNPPSERLPIRTIRFSGGSAVSIDSPILLLGDSHALVFHVGEDLHARNAGLADHLAVELGVPIDVLGVRGSGATPARLSLYRRASENPGYLDRKKIVVWIFAARDFTEALNGWRPLPIEPARK